LYFPVVFLPQRLYFPCHFPPSCVVPAFPYPENAPITYVLYFRMLTARFFRLLPNAGINILPIFSPRRPPPLYFFISLFSSHLLPFAPSSPPFFLSAAFSDTFSYRLLFQPSALFAAFFSCRLLPLDRLPFCRTSKRSPLEIILAALINTKRRKAAC